MILHIVNDQKFIEAGISNFEEVIPGENLAIAIHDKTKPLKYVKNVNISFFSKRELFSLKFVKLLKSSKALIFHALYPDYLYILRIAASVGYKGKIVWIGWGFDYYDLLVETGFELYEEDTKAKFSTIFNENKLKTNLSKKDKIKNYIRKILFNKKTLIRKIDYFAPVLHEDYKLIDELINNFHPKFARWNYGQLARALDKIDQVTHKKSENLLLGNSADPTNNHLEVFKLLPKEMLHNRKLIVPLSYPDFPEYRKSIIEIGKEMFGNTFTPFVDFIPLEEYTTSIASCSHIIMNHRRQQAGGNIAISIYQGATIFLNEFSTFYQFYKNNGFHIYKVSDIKIKPHLLDNLLSEQQILENRNLLEHHLGKNRIRQNTIELTKLLFNT